MRTYLAVGLSLLFGVTGALHAGDAPLGHKNFYPSDERPVGWRGDGNGWFPGATPVTHWQVAKVQRGSHGKPDTVLNRDRVNIAWEVTPPGWISSSPIVVGDRVFLTFNPHGLACVDANTGKILWTRTHSPFLMDGLPEKRAAELDELWEVVRGVETIGGYLSGLDKKVRGEIATKNGAANANALGATLLARLRKEVERLDAELLPAFDKDAAIVDGLGTKDAGKLILTNFGTAFHDRYKVVGELQFFDYTGYAMPTPCSDGRRVYVVYGNGQTACYDLDGNRLWWKRFPVARGPFARWVADYSIVSSPLLSGDILVVAYKKWVRGFDKTTGKVLWEKDNVSGDPGAACDGKLLGIPQGAATVPVICWPWGQVQRVSDGEILGKSLREFRRGIAGTGNKLLGVVDKALQWQQLSLDAAGTLQTELSTPFNMDGYTSHAGYVTDTITDTHTLRSYFIWSHDGKRIGKEANLFKEGRVNRYECSLVAGRMAIIPDGEGGHGGGAQPRIRRATGFGRYHTVDLSDPENPVAINSNVLGGTEKPRLPEIERLLPEIYAADAYAHRVLPYKFAPYYTGGIFASGNRLFIATTAKLYCIGDPSVPYDWNPASRPAEVTAALEQATKEKKK